MYPGLASQCPITTVIIIIIITITIIITLLFITGIIDKKKSWRINKINQ